MKNRLLWALLVAAGLAQPAMALTMTSAPASLTFDATTVGSGQLKTVVITNTTTAAQQVSVTPPTTDFLVESNGCAGISLAPQATCSIGIRFIPTTSGSRTGTFLIKGSTADQSAVALSGTGVALNTAQLQAQPGILVLPNTLLGQTSSSSTVTLTSAGTTPVTLTGITASPSSEFLVTQDCLKTLAPGDSCPVKLSFKPAASGGRTGSLVVTHNGLTGRSSVQLGGTGVSPFSIYTEPDHLEFGSLAVGTSSPMQSMNLYNGGTTDIPLNPLSVTGNSTDFTVSHSCGTLFKAGTVCTVNAVFSPKSAGGRNAIVNLTTGTGNTLVQSLSVAGTGTAQGVLTMNPTSLTFPSTTAGTTSAGQTVTVKNTGNANLSITQMAADVSDYAWTTNCGTLTPGATCTLTVKFSPTTTGAKAGTLTIAHNGAGGSATLPLSGAGAAAAGLFAASPTTLAFGNVNLGTSSATQTVTLTNTGGSPVALSSASVNLSDYAIVSNTCMSAVAPGATCSLSVKFTPAVVGTRTGTLALSYPGVAMPLSVGLTGTGVGVPNIGLNPTSVAFTATTLGSQSAEQAITVTNTGTAPLTVSNLVLSSADFVQRNTCGTAIAPQSACSVYVKFSPQTVGALTGSLTLSHNAGTGTSVVALSGTGNPLPGTLSITPLAYAFADTSVAQVRDATNVLTLKNTGGTALTLAVPTSSSAEFSQTAWTCGTSLAAGASCTASLRFSPTAVGSRSASLTYSTAGGPVAVSLTGNGLNAAQITATPASLTFPVTTVGTTSAAQVITLKNTGATPLSISGVGVPSAFATQYVVGNTCTSTLAPAATCTVTVAFSPKAAGSQSATLTVTSNAVNAASLSIPLTASAVAPGSLTANPNPIVLADTLIGAATTKVVTLTNTGGSALSALALSGLTTELAGTHNCGASLAAGASCQVTLTFRPTVAGARTGTFNVTATGMPAFPLNWSGNAIKASVSVVTQPHPATQLGTPSTATHTVTNNTSMPVRVLSDMTGVTTVNPTVSGTGFIYVSTTCPTTGLAAGSSCTVTTRCTASPAGNLTGTLTVPYQGGTATGPLTCAVQAPSATLTAEGPVTPVVGGWSRSGDWYRLRNTGIGPITVTALTPANANWGMVYTATNSAHCSPNKTLQAGQDCLVMAQLLTGAPGQSFTGTQTVATTAGNYTIRSNVQTKGFSFTPVTAFPTSFQNGSAYTAQYTVTNTAPFGVSGVTATVVGAGLTVDASACTAIPANGSCLLKLTYVAPTTGTAMSGSVTLNGAYPQVINGVASPSVNSGAQGSLPFTGTLAVPKLTVTPGVFTRIRVGETTTATHTVTNAGAGPVTLGAPAVTAGPHSLLSSTCGATLAVGQSCTVTTRFSPTSATALSGVLTVPYNTSYTASATLLGQVVQQSDVRVTTSANAANILKGGSVTYTSTVTNGVAGPATVTLNLATTAAGGASVASKSTPTCTITGCTVSGSTVTMTLAANQSAAVTQVVTAGATTGTITETASLQVAGVDDPVSANNTASATTTVSDPLADLGVSLSGITATTATGGKVTLTVTVRNNSATGGLSAPGANFNLGVSQSVAGFTVGPVTCTTVGTGASCAAGSLTGYLPPGATATFSAPLTASLSAMTDTITATVTSAAGGVTDAVPGNNTASVTTSIANMPTQKRCVFTSTVNEPYTGPVAGNGAACSLGFTTSLAYFNWMSPYLFDGKTTRSNYFGCMGAAQNAFYWNYGTITWKNTTTKVTGITQGNTVSSYIPIAQVYVAGQWKDDPWAWYAITGSPAPRASALFHCNTTAAYGCTGAVGRLVRSSQGGGFYPQQTYWNWNGGGSTGYFTSAGSAKDGSSWRQTWIENSPGPSCAAPGTTRIDPPGGASFWPIAYEYASWSLTN